MKVETKRCYLRDISHCDVDNFVILNSSTETKKYLGGVKNEQEAIAEFDKILNKDDSIVRFSIYNKETNEFMGFIKLNKHHDYDENEVSYMMLKKWWNQGYGFEILTKVLSIGFDELKLKMIYAETQTANKAACKLLEKCEMTKVKELYRFGEKQTIYLKEK